MAPSENRDTSVQQRTHDNSIKVAKPDYYYGDRSKLDDWLNQMALYFRFENITQDPKKTLLASSYLRGQVQQWIRPRCYEHGHETDRPEAIGQ